MNKLSLLFAGLAVAGTAFGQAFNGTSENYLPTFFYAATADQFVNGATLDGDTGALYYTHDDAPFWNGFSGAPGGPNVWTKEVGFGSGVSGLAFDLSIGGTTVFSNNSIAEGDPNGNYLNGGANARGAYSMENNFDFVYAGYFALEQDTRFDSLSMFYYTGDPFNTGIGWDPSFLTGWTWSIWSVDQNGGPVNTGGFTGDVLSSDLLNAQIMLGDFSVSQSATNGINALNFDFIPGASAQLGAGEYYLTFSPRVAAPPVVPEASTYGILGAVFLGLLVVIRRLRK